MVHIKDFILSNGFSLFLSSLAIVLSYLFWKNPIDNEIKKTLFIKDEENNTDYIIGEKCKKWIVEKIVVRNIDKGEPFKFFANKKNNPKTKEAPKDLEELRKLTYSLEK